MPVFSTLTNCRVASALDYRVVQLKLTYDDVFSRRRMNQSQREAFEEALIEWRNDQAEKFQARYFFILPAPEVQFTLRGRYSICALLGSVQL